jgi:ATP-binding cassette subfamily F protein 3
MIAISDLTYRLGERLLLDGASAALPVGGRIGVIGRNGVGKSTLFRLITGEISPESGEVTLPAGARLGQVAQQAPSGPGTLVDIVLAGDAERAALLAEAETAADPHRIADIHARLADIGAHSAPARAAAILHGLGFPASEQARPITDFSSGWRMRVALAVALFTEPELLLLDEPTNYLDIEGVLWLQEHLARYPHSLMIISHDRDFLDVAADHILHLEHGKLSLYRGNYSNFEIQDAARREQAEKAAVAVEGERQRLQAFVDRFKAKASKASQARSRMKRLEKLASVTILAREGAPRIVIPDPAKPLASPLVALDRASVGYGERTVLRGLSLGIGNDDRIGLLGANGNGKSTLVGLIAGRLSAQSGEVRRAPKLTVASFSPLDLERLPPHETALLMVRRKLPPDTPEAKVRGMAAQLGFPAAKVETPVGQLSGGERTRLVIGLATLGGPHLVILDEPTNHLDIEARDALVAALTEYKGAAIIVSHDRRLLESTCDRLWIVKDGGVSGFDGDIDDYRRLVGESARAQVSAESERAAGAGDSLQERRRRNAGRRQELAPLRAAIQARESEMERLGGLLKRLDAALADPEVYRTDTAKAARLTGDRAALARRLAESEEAWLEASAAYDEAMAAG